MTTDSVQPPFEAEDAARSTRSWSRYALKLAVAVALVAWVLRRTDLADVAATAASADILLISLVLASHFLGVFISTSRWQLLLGSQGVHATAARLYGSFLVASFFNHFLPSNIGGDGYRSYENWRLGTAPATSILVTITERVLGLVALLLFVLVALLFAAPAADVVDTGQISIAAGALLVLLAAAVTAGSTARARRAIPRFAGLLPARLQKPARDVVSALSRFRGRRGVVLRAFGLSVLLQINVVIAYYLLGRALDLPIALAGYFVIVPIAVVAMMIPISINAIGVRENVFAAMMSLYGVSLAAAVAFAWLALGVEALIGLIGALVYAARRESVRGVRSRRPPAPAREPARADPEPT